MVYAKSYDYHDAKVPMKCFEGTFTTNSAYVLGGAFANELADGDPVKLVGTATFAVEKATSTDVPIGYCDGSPRGLSQAEGRHCNVQLYGIMVKGVTLASDSGAITAGDNLVCAAGLWSKTTESSDVTALGAIGTASIGAGSAVIPALFGKYSVG